MPQAGDSSAVNGGMDLAALLDVEPWARVHAFNCLRHIFTDSNLTVDTSGYFADGLKVRIPVAADMRFRLHCST